MPIGAAIVVLLVVGSFNNTMHPNNPNCFSPSEPRSQLNQHYSAGTPSPDPFRSKSHGSNSSSDSATAALYDTADSLLRPLQRGRGRARAAADAADDDKSSGGGGGPKAKRFPCPECGKLFGRVSHVRRHQQLHTGSKPFECTVCGDRFTRLENRDRHMIMHTKVRPYNCERCGKGFTQLNRLKVHRLTHTGERPYTCELCAKRFLRVDHLRVHMRTHRDEWAAGGAAERLLAISMEVGGGGVEAEDAAAEEEDEERDEERDDRPVTPTIEMPHSDDFVITMVSAATGVSDATVVDQSATAIDYSSSSSSSAKSSVRSTPASAGVGAASIVETKPFQCPACPKQFARRDHYRRHVDVHSGARPFQCDLCPKRFSRKDNKYSHMVGCLLKNYGVAVDDGCELPRGMLQRTMDERVRAVLGDAYIEPVTQLHELDEEAEPAEEAGTAAAVEPEEEETDVVPVALVQRRLTDDADADADDGEYPEPIAGLLKVRDLNELAILPVAADTSNSSTAGQTPRCELCDITFATRGTLHRHELLHKNERPFGCDRCDKTFQRRDHLMRHQSVHNASADAQWSQPPASQLTVEDDVDDDSGRLRRPSSDDRQPQPPVEPVEPIELTVSPDVNGDEFDYRCEVCDKTFQSKSNLVRHVALHTTERPFACDRCEKTFSRKEHLQRHVIGHTGIRPFRCPYCKRTFVEQNQQRRHVLEKHAAEAAAAALAQPVEAKVAVAEDCGGECVMASGELWGRTYFVTEE